MVLVGGHAEVPLLWCGIVLAVVAVVGGGKLQNLLVTFNLTQR